MRAQTDSAPSHPILPAPLTAPLRIIPSYIHTRALVTILNNVFESSLRDGDLDFLLGRTVKIVVEDAGMDYRLTFNGYKLIPADENSVPDLHLQGTLYNFMLLAGRHEDSDTLFFSRRLHMQGDTELGLYVKNFLDGMDMDSHRIPALFETVIRKSLPWYAHLFG